MITKEIHVRGVRAITVNYCTIRNEIGCSNLSETYNVTNEEYAGLKRDIFCEILVDATKTTKTLICFIKRTRNHEWTTESFIVIVLLTEFLSIETTSSRKEDEKVYYLYTTRFIDLEGFKKKSHLNQGAFSHHIAEDVYV